VFHFGFAENVGSGQFFANPAILRRVRSIVKRFLLTANNACNYGDAALFLRPTPLLSFRRSNCQAPAYHRAAMGSVPGDFT
jgi:hypothetical protein